ncbi:hypothetical protein EWF20_11370 [Sulfolobus sp. S-194]|uniref:hypothetical protein n=1 Tax=Sulfolobus sp. S-194 TaxID=2512240 RepID=UPI00143737B5|nr:hypothetical protein [Sulfolobus sp. S-194]QIW24672.1 hypothetical protein EWF20_11370 [Sulfolobus sp. S-194]
MKLNMCAILAIFTIIFILFFYIYYSGDVLSIEQAFYSIFPGSYINIFFKKDGKYIGNATVYAYVFYPNREGITTFSLVYSANKTGEARIPLGNLVKFAERWINYSKFYIIPSILGIASYYIKLNSSTIQLITQTFTINYNLSEILQGIGKTITIQFNNTINRIVRLKGRKSTIGEETKTPTITIISEPCFLIILSPKIIAWYPNSSSVAPIALATFIGPTVNESMYGGILTAALLNVGFYISQPSLPPQNPIRVSVPGPSLIVNDIMYNVSVANSGPIGRSSPYNYDVVQLYILGQVAWVNWTETVYFADDGSSATYFYQVILTRVVVNQKGNGMTTIVYDFNSNYGGLRAPIGLGNMTLYSNIPYNGKVTIFSLEPKDTYIPTADGLNVGALFYIADYLVPGTGSLAPFFSLINIVVKWKIATIILDLDNYNPYYNLSLYYYNYSNVKYYINGNYCLLQTYVYYATWSQ